MTDSKVTRDASHSAASATLLATTALSGKAGSFAPPETTDTVSAARSVSAAAVLGSVSPDAARSEPVIDACCTAKARCAERVSGLKSGAAIHCGADGFPDFGDGKLTFTGAGTYPRPLTCVV